MIHRILWSLVMLSSFASFCVAGEPSPVGESSPPPSRAREEAGVAPPARPSRSKRAMDRAIDDHRFTSSALQEAEAQAKDAAAHVAELEKGVRESEKNGADPGVLKVLRDQAKQERRKLSALEAEVRSARRNYRIAQSSLKKFDRRKGATGATR